MRIRSAPDDGLIEKVEADGDPLCICMPVPSCYEELSMLAAICWLPAEDIRTCLVCEGAVACYSRRKLRKDCCDG